ncbi:MAG: GTPase HflX [Candidatus Marinimicrobia bacterium]|nr:GTPase HflX [Candidatus Neomarinimicrobiota bacterium]
MIEKNKGKKFTENAFLVGAVHSNLTPIKVNEHLHELELLAQTAGANVVHHFVQKINKINPSYFIGTGKAKLIIEQAISLNISLIIFDDELSPAQIKNFSNLSKDIKVIDRSSLILEIFSQHAQTKEAKTQVELAQLEYLLPRLTRAWTHLERQMGGIGTRAGAGETQIEVDRRIVRARISNLKKELIKIDKERETQRKKRKHSYKVSLAGYTNAGKSTLMKSLSGSDVYIQDKLFATLDTTIRSVSLDKIHTILLSDTVGFVRKLPHHLVASFRSTLKEIVESNLILIVLDSSSDYVLDHYETITQVLKDIGANKQSLVVLNKIDLIKSKSKFSFLKNAFPDGIYISALDQLRIDSLKNSIIDKMDKDYTTIELKLPYEKPREIAFSQRDVDIIERDYRNDHIYLKIRGPAERIDQIQLMLKK